MGAAASINRASARASGLAPDCDSAASRSSSGSSSSSSVSASAACQAVESPEPGGVLMLTSIHVLHRRSADDTHVHTFAAPAGAGPKSCHHDLQCRAGGGPFAPERALGAARSEEH